MNKRRKIYYAIIALVLTVILSSYINKLVTNGFLLVFLLFFTMFFVLTESMHNVIKKVDIKKNIVMSITAISGITLLSSVLIGRFNTVANKDIIIVMFSISFCVFIIAGPYLAGIEKRK